MIFWIWVIDWGLAVIPLARYLYRDAGHSELGMALFMGLCLGCLWPVLAVLYLADFLIGVVTWMNE